ncbi:MAG: pirin family protein [Puia sp.]
MNRGITPVFSERAYCPRFNPGDFRDTDPFILLMDDMLDKKTNEHVGGPHPHAGFETVTLMLEGEIGDEVHKMKAGDLQMMTAGGGVIHTETMIKKPG